MHELSVALEVCRMAETTLGTASCADLMIVGVQVGSEAGIEYDNFEFCLTTLLSQPPFGRARVQLERAPGDVLNLAYLEVDDGDPYD